jgi:hypothetical protein
MPAGFEFADEVFWGSNGAVEAYVETLAQLAAERFGDADDLAAFFRDEAGGFFTGKVVFLTEVLPDKPSRDKFLHLLAAASERLRDEFTDLGRAWIDDVIRRLGERITAPAVSRGRTKQTAEGSSDIARSPRVPASSG